MYPAQKQAFALGVLAALLWSPHYYVLEPLRAEGVPVLVMQFHLVFWPALALLVLLAVTGGAESLSVFKRRETHFLLLAATGGYGFYVLRALALGAGPSHAHLLFYSAPLLMGLFSLLTRESADQRVALGLLLGFVGCIMIAEGQSTAGAAAGTESWAGNLLAVGAAGCWALFALLARPVVREERALPTAALVLGIGAACLLVTCLSTGENVFGVSVRQLGTLALWGLVSVGLMTTAWLKFLASVPAALAAPFWYLGLGFGVLWARRAGWTVSPWLAAPGAALLLVALYSAAAGRRSRGLTIGDIIRG